MNYLKVIVSLPHKQLLCSQSNQHNLKLQINLPVPFELNDFMHKLSDFIP